MKGIPLRIELGPRDLEKDQCVVAKRYNGEKLTLDLDIVGESIPSLLEHIHEQMYQNALINVLDNTRETNDYEEFKKIIDQQGGYVKMMWCGEQACEEKVKADTTATSRCMPFDQTPIGDICPVCGKQAKHLVFYAKAY